MALLLRSGYPVRIRGLHGQTEAILDEDLEQVDQCSVNEATDLEAAGVATAQSCFFDHLTRIFALENLIIA